MAACTHEIDDLAAWVLRTRRGLKIIRPRPTRGMSAVAATIGLGAVVG